LSKRRVLILAQDCNPEWPSLPVVGYKYARALANVADVTIATHVRNRENIEKADELGDQVVYIDTEWIASPMYKLGVWLRGGKEVAWTMNQIMAYLPNLVFERQVLRHFKSDLKTGDFDIVHRVTPMSQTLPSYMAGKTKQPFVLGPLNGNLDWPPQFAAEQKRERERIRKIREAYRFVPYARSSQRNPDCLLASFQHTIDDLKAADPVRIVPMPEVGVDVDLFHDKGRTAPFQGKGPFRFLYAGRLVPYKLSEVAVRAFVSSDSLKPHKLHVLGSGPELARLQAIVAEAGAQDRVIFEGNKTQAEVAEAMRLSDAFIFPSIRELGAGVVIEAMACGTVCFVADYGAPGALVGSDRGVRIQMAGTEDLVNHYRDALETCIREPARHADMATRAAVYARDYFDWDAKARYTADIYEALLAKKPLDQFDAYEA
jgi:glycosyltransferase involved in cell wall biosynthesis